MANVDKAQLHDFVNGEVVDESKLDQNFEVLRVAGNDTNTKVNTISANGAIGTANLADGSVTTAKIASGALDGRYYTESEIDTQMGTKADTSYVNTQLVFKEDSANKATTMTGNTTNNVVFLTAKAVYDWATGLFAPKDSPTFTGTVTLPSTTSIGNVSATELNYLDGATSNIQAQINSFATGTGFVQKTGDTMTGPLSLPSNGFTVGTNQFVVNSNRIGIGTSTPTAGYVMEVVGLARFSSGFSTQGFAADNMSYFNGGFQATGTVILPSTTTIGGADVSTFQTQINALSAGVNLYNYKNLGGSL